MVPVESSNQGAEDGAQVCRKVVMLLEDDLLLRWPTAEYLRDLGYRVIEGATAAEAMAVLASGTQVDIVFSDINLQGELTGHSLADWVGKYQPDLPLLMTSEDRDAAAPLALGATRSFISKPYLLTDIDRRIKEMLSRK